MPVLPASAACTCSKMGGRAQCCVHPSVPASPNHWVPVTPDTRARLEKMERTGMEWQGLYWLRIQGLCLRMHMPSLMWFSWVLVSHTYTHTHTNIF